jgi:predicted DNA-binding protein (MmcQ/YjbR family)
MTKQELIDYCLTFAGAYEDYPFDDIWAVMRHGANKKGFAFIYERDGKVCVNVKCEPNKADFLRQVYNDLTPGYHFNKRHWNTIFVGGDVPEQEIRDMIQESYDLIKPSNKKMRNM